MAKALHPTLQIAAFQWNSALHWKERVGSSLLICCCCKKALNTESLFYSPTCLGCAPYVPGWGGTHSQRNRRNVIQSHTQDLHSGFSEKGAKAWGTVREFHIKKPDLENQTESPLSCSVPSYKEIPQYMLIGTNPTKWGEIASWNLDKAEWNSSLLVFLYSSQGKHMSKIIGHPMSGWSYMSPGRAITEAEFRKESPLCDSWQDNHSVWNLQPWKNCIIQNYQNKWYSQHEKHKGGMEA